MYPNGDIYFNYLDLQGDYNSATVGMQNQNASDAITMGANNTDTLLSDNFSISIKQTPNWVEIGNESGNLSDGEGTTVSVTITAEDLGDGIYNSYLFVNTNAEDITIPIVLNVNDEPQIPGDINNDGSLNVQDLVILVNDYILVGQYDSIGDINEDGNLNVLDIIILVTFILG